MDFFDKAQDLIDRAQEKVADATTVAARKANQAVRVKTLDGQKRDLERQIETVTLQLGNGVYQMWKNRGGRDDQKMEELCRALDEVLARYRDVIAERARLDQTTDDGGGAAPRLGGAAATILSPAPENVPLAEIVSPPSRQRDQPHPATPPQPSAAPASTRGPHVPAPAQRTAPEAPPAPAPPRASKAKSCPSCGTMVPAGVMYCPQCGYMAR